MVILHVIGPGEFGGAEEVVQALAEGHHRRAHDALRGRHSGRERLSSSVPRALPVSRY